MIRFFTLFFIFNVSVSYAGQLQLRSGLLYESNTYYSSDNEKSDFVLVLEPSGSFEKTMGFYSLYGNGDFLYSKYASESNQDFYEYNLKLDNYLKLSDRWKFYLNPHTELESEPAIASSYDRLERSFIGTDTGLVFQETTSDQWRLNFSYLQESLSQTLYEYLNNSEMRGLLTYRKYFLPETFLAFVLRTGIKSYPDGDLTSNSAFKKYDSMRVEPGMAVVGRITKYLKIRTYAGFVYLTYEKEDGFKEPVFLIEFEEQLSPKDSILIGYDYSVEDTYHGNYLLMQKMYMGYARFLGDQVLLTTNLEYLYRFFSSPYRRNDQRFYLNVRGEYSYTQSTKIELVGAYDLNSSDSFNNLPSTVLPNRVDQSVSYDAYSVGIFLKHFF